ncbi:MAG: enoyl-CoA hydratase-related protein, partial [Actinomycetota bacterium]|nr:enoyl-CoA hydratase-related protein [Actinomycetota bacterium]
MASGCRDPNWLYDKTHFANLFYRPVVKGLAVELERILFDVSDHVATITLNRPERLNATDDLARTELGWAWGQVRDDPEIRVAIITGAGERAFCAGQDVRATAASGIRNKVPGSRLHHNVWKPVICALNGMVVGGGLHQVADSDL